MNRHIQKDVEKGKKTYVVALYKEVTFEHSFFLRGFSLFYFTKSRLRRTGQTERSISVFYRAKSPRPGCVKLLLLITLNKEKQDISKLELT